LGKLNFTPPLLFQLPHSREGISTGTTSACDICSIEENDCIEVFHTTLVQTTLTGDVATSVQTPSACDGSQATSLVQTTSTGDVATLVQATSPCNVSLADDIWPDNLVDRVRSILQLPIRQPSRLESGVHI